MGPHSDAPNQQKGISMRYLLIIIFVTLLFVPSSIAKVPSGYSERNLKNVVGWWKVIDHNTRVGYLDKNKKMCQTIKIIKGRYYATKPYPCN
jgi:hypothetical protein